MSKFKQLVLYFVLLVITVGLLLGISRVESRLDRDIKEHHLRFEGDVNNAPPFVAFTTMALGSFRGLLADVLWLRANSLQDEGNYFEMVQLANWITELQPTFSGATVYLAWNMAYNISVTCSRREDRWRWVQEGIRLIRDKAINYNPEDPQLYKDLAWTFMHKMGQIMDDANLYYKNQWAINMDRVIGAKPDWPALVAAPAGKAKFLKRWPEKDPVWLKLAAVGYPDYPALLTGFIEAGKLPDKALEALTPEQQQAMGDGLRASWLYDSFRMEPEVIVEINNTYGALDWRTMEAQAIYWAFMGLKKTPGHKDLNCERIITQALAISFRNGRIIYLDKLNSERVIMVPNLNLAQGVIDTYDKAFDDNKSQSFVSAKLNFYKDAIVMLYSYGRIAEAGALYHQLREQDPTPHKEPLDLFVQREWAEDVKNASQPVITSLLFARLTEMYLYIGSGDLDTAKALREQAFFMYTDYQKNAQSDVKLEQRIGLPPFNTFMVNAYEAVLNALDDDGRAQLQARIAVMVEQEKAERKAREENGAQ